MMYSLRILLQESFLRKENDMKKIVLLGDSIRMGYDKYIKDALEGVAEVYYPDDNVRFGEYFLRFAHEWKEKGKWPDDIDLVHWNVGLWDVLNLYDDGPLSTPEYYENIIGRLEKRLRMLFPDAKMIFATSTNVVEEEYGKHFCRYNREIMQYNEIAKSVLTPRGVEINDLYALTENCTKECRSDMTHFNTDAGRELVGGRVLSVICNALGIDEKSLVTNKFVKEDYTDDSIGA